MSKYIIEIPDDTRRICIDVFGEGYCYTQAKSVDDLEELNSDYINEHYGDLQDVAYQKGYDAGIIASSYVDKSDEAYQRGHDDGYEAGCATAFKPVSDAEYQRGLDDAMNAFKKLYSCGWERDWKAMGFEFDEGEWSASFEYIIGHYTATEIVEKVKAYEKSPKRFGIGDFVSHDNVPEIIVLVTYISRDTFNGVAITDVEDHCRKGEPYTYCASEDWHKVNMQLVKGEDNA